jgi:5-methylcytosine-specific restriction endonuclease McrBC regulatory subunit McrC
MEPANMSSEVKRCEPVIYIAQPPTWMRELEYGDYVKYTDYAAAIAERDRWIEVGNSTAELLKKAIAERDEARAEVDDVQGAAIERLTNVHCQYDAEVERLKACNTGWKNLIHELKAQHAEAVALLRRWAYVTEEFMPSVLRRETVDHLTRHDAERQSGEKEGSEG